MFILGDLIYLPMHEERLPLPWWHRAPLAFESGTSMFVALTKPKDDRPGDILASVLDPNHWDKTIRIRCQYKEATGVIAKVFGIMAQSYLNIALAETATIEGARLHALDLYCEPFGFPTEKPKKDELKKSLEKGGFTEILINELEPPRPPIIWNRKGQVDSGWVSAKNLNWKQQVNMQLKEMGQKDNFEVNKLILSADTDKRFLRFVIPRSGARTVTIEHADEPGALRELTTAIQKAELNVLSCLLKRGGVPSGNAVLVAICEPARSFDEDKMQSLDEFLVKEIPQRYRPHLDIKTGLPPEKVIYSRHKEDLVIHVPRHLKPRIIDRRSEFIKNKYPVFISQRFTDERTENYAGEVREVLKKNNCEVVQAPILSGGTLTSLDEVSSAMWAARAAIILVAQPEDESQAAFSLNLAHEFGFFRGQGKPVLIIVEDRTRAIGDLDKFTNAKGIIAPRFNHEQAFNRNHSQSINKQIIKWLRTILE